MQSGVVQRDSVSAQTKIIYSAGQKCLQITNIDKYLRFSFSKQNMLHTVWYKQKQPNIGKWKFKVQKEEYRNHFLIIQVY